MPESAHPLNKIEHLLQTMSKPDTVAKEVGTPSAENKDTFFATQLRGIYDKEKHNGRQRLSGILDQLDPLLENLPPDAMLHTRCEALRCRAFLELHAGGWNQELGERYGRFLTRHRDAFFLSRLMAWQQDLEDRLSLFQIHFNALDFDSVIPEVESELNRYQQIMQDLDDNVPCQRDIMLARLHGTLGQALLFLGDLHGEQDMILRGREHLERDLALLCPERDQRHFSQGVNFIVTARWMAGELEGAWDFWASTGQTIEHRFELNGGGSIMYPQALSDGGQAFGLLNQLRLLALEQRMRGQKVQGLKKLMVGLLKPKNLPEHPTSLILKWTAWLMWSQNELDEETKSALQDIVKRLMNDPVSPLETLLWLPLGYLVDCSGELLEYLERQGREQTGWRKLAQRKATVFEAMRVGDKSMAWEGMRCFPYYFG